MDNDDEKDEEVYQTNEENGNPKLEYSDYPDDSKKIDPMICVVCEKEPKYTFENQNSELCRDCRETFIRYPVPKWLYIVIAVVAVTLCFAAYKVPAVINDFKIYKAAEISYNQKNYTSASNGYMSLGEKYKSALRINERLFLSLMKSQRFDDASTILNSRLAEKDGSEETYDEIYAYTDMLNKFYAADEKIALIIQDETINSDTAKIYINLEKLVDDKECSTSLVLFYLAQLNIGQNKVEKAIAQLKEACTLEPQLTFITSYLGNAQRRIRQYDEAINSYNTALSLNFDDESAFRGLGVICLLKGENAKGLEYIKNAYNLNKYGDFVANTYVVALYANGKTTESKALYEEIKKMENYQIDPDIESYIAGNSTLEKLYIN